MGVPRPFLVPDDFRAFMKAVAGQLDTPGAAPELLDAEDALRHETGYGGRIDGEDRYRFIYIAPDGRYKWELQVTGAAIRDIADGLLIEVAGVRTDLSRSTRREPKGYPLLTWGEYDDDALLARDRAEIVAALDALHALAQVSPRLLRMWSATDDQIVAMMLGNECALYVVESLDGYATSCGDRSGGEAFVAVDPYGQPFVVPLHDCVPWRAAQAALLQFVDHGDLGPAIRVEGRIPSGLLMMGDVDRQAALEARADPPRTLGASSLPRMLALTPEDLTEETLDEPAPTRRMPSSPRLADLSITIEEAAVWARRLLAHLHAHSLIEIGAPRLDEIANQLVGVLQAHGAEAQRSPEVADWLAGKIGAARGVDRMHATGADLQIALHRSREP